MARTLKWEHKTDSFHMNHRLERQARPAGRLLALVEAELAEDEEDAWSMYYVPADEFCWEDEVHPMEDPDYIVRQVAGEPNYLQVGAIWYDVRLLAEPGCACRRCAPWKMDFGGCIPAWAIAEFLVACGCN